MSRYPLVPAMLALGLSFLAALPVTAQTNPTITTLHTFDNVHGANPLSKLVQGADGNFYGVTQFGGKAVPDGNEGGGTIYRIDPVTHQFTTLYKFGGSDGEFPIGSLIQAKDGAFYGTTSYGGAADRGTLFKITSGGVFTSLHSFTGSEGKSPEAGLIQGTDGAFYGTTQFGGVNNYGTIFKVTSSGTLTTLYKFADKPTTGAYSYGALVQDADGSFYGTTSGGGKYDKGVVFRLRPNGSYTVLHTFDDTYGANPYYSALVKGAGGFFYGTTRRGGINKQGTLFKITSTGTFTTLHKFSSDLNGQNPFAGLESGPDGNFYGTTATGGYPSGYGEGTVFVMTPQGRVTTLYKFHSPTLNDAAHGSTPVSVTVGADGALYGSTYRGGVIDGKATDYGTLFKLTLPQ